MQSSTETRSTLALMFARLAETRDWVSLSKSIGTYTGILGAIWLAARIQTSGYAYILMLASTLTWGFAAWRMGERRLLALNTIWAAINLLGILRYCLM